MKIRPVGAEMFHADGHTDRYDEADHRFSHFCVKRLNTLNLMKNRQRLFIFSIKIVDACTEQTCRYVRQKTNFVKWGGVWGAASAKWERPPPAGNSIS